MERAKPTLAQTAKEAATILGLCCASEIPISRFNLPIGTAMSDQLARLLIDNPRISYPLLTLVVPVIEETVYRLIPARLYTKKGNSAWAVGIATSALFALEHLRKSNYDPSDMGIERKISLHQFLLGLYSWHILKNKGFSHSLIAHATFNALGLTGSILANRLNKKQ